MWEWLVWVAPTPQELEQQTECTRRLAKDKKSEIAIVAAAAAPPSSDPSMFRQAARVGRMWWCLTLPRYIKRQNAMQCDVMPEAWHCSLQIFLAPHRLLTVAIRSHKHLQGTSGTDASQLLCPSELTQAAARQRKHTSYLLRRVSCQDYCKVCSTWTLTSGTLCKRIPNRPALLDTRSHILPIFRYLFSIKRSSLA